MTAYKDLIQQQGGIIVPSGVRRPHWICSNVKQHVFGVRDKSPSMRGQKGKDASAASLDFVHELAQPANKDGFNVAMIDFAGSVQLVHNLTKATELDGKVTPLSPGLLNGGTNITAGLQIALDLLEAAENNQQEGVMYLRPVVICFTDGCHNTGPHPREVANQLKQKADLVTVAFGSDADEALLRELASTPQHFYRPTQEQISYLMSIGVSPRTISQSSRVDPSRPPPHPGGGSAVRIEETPTGLQLSPPQQRWKALVSVLVFILLALLAARAAIGQDSMLPPMTTPSSPSAETMEKLQ